MRQEFCDFTTDEVFLTRVRSHRKAIRAGEALQVNVGTLRVPGPLPTLDHVDQAERSTGPSPAAEPRPTHVEMVTTPTTPPVPSLEPPTPMLAKLRSPLQYGFTVLLVLDLPFIVYALSWHAGFDLTVVTYPMVAAFLGVSTVSIWLSSRGAVLWKVGAIVARTPMLPWISLQVFPIAGFVLWHRGGLGSLDRLIPLFVVALAFILTVGLPSSPWATSARDPQWHEGAGARLPRIDQSRALSRW
jgi:hypothetical protein